MRVYRYSRKIKKAEGYQVFEVSAEDEKQALRMAENHEGLIVEDDCWLEVLELDNFDVETLYDVEEVEKATAREMLQHSIENSSIIFNEFQKQTALNIISHLKNPQEWEAQFLSALCEKEGPLLNLENLQRRRTIKISENGIL